MKAAVRYYTKTGNTKRICDAIAEAIGVEANSVDVPLEEETEVLFLREPTAECRSFAASWE